MSSRLRPVALALALASLASLACAQASAAAAAAPSSAAALPGSLSEAVAQALSQRPELHAAEQKMAGARARIQQAAARFYPSLDLGLTARNGILYDRFSGIQATASFMGQPTVIDVNRTQPRYTVTPQLRLSYDLYSGGRDTAVRRNAEALERSSAAESDVLARDILREVIVNHLQLLKAHQRWLLAQRWLAYADTRLELTRTLLAKGQRSELELQSDLQAQRQRHLELQSAGQTLASRYTDYMASLGRSPDALGFDARQLDALHEQLEPQLRALASADVAQAIGLSGTVGTNAQAELQRARAEADAARQNIAAERAGYAPQINVYTTYSANGRSEQDMARALQLRRNTFEVGVTVSLNLFSGFGTLARVDEAQAQAQRMAIEVDRLAAQQKLVHAKLASELAQSQDQERFAHERRELAALRLRVAQSRAELGRDTLDSVDLARMELAAVDTDIVCSRIDTAMAQVKLQFASSTYPM